MGAGVWKIYGRAKKSLLNGTITLGAGVFKMCLLRNSASALGVHVLSTRSTWASISGTEISARGGYAAGGRNLPGVAWGSLSAIAMKFYFTNAGLSFTASGSALNNIRFAVIRNSTGAGAGKLLCFCTLSSAAFTISSPNIWTMFPPATGIFTLK